MTDRNIEDLSTALDKINSGQTPECPDSENAGLLEVAALLHKSGLQARPPEHILAASVQRAAEGLAAPKSSHHGAWIYSSVLGAAAALLIFVGIHGFISIQDVAPIATPVPASSSSAAQPGGTSSMPAERAYLPKPSSSGPASSIPDSAAAPAAQPEPEPNSQSVVPPSRTPAAPPATRQVPSAASAMKAALPPSSPASGSQVQAPAEAVLQLPGRTPESVVVDPATGILRQVFDSGTTRELIITQRTKPQAQSGATLQSRQQVVREADKGKAEAIIGLNKVVVLINGQEVTLEGRQTTQELTELARTLRP